jgi:hypothetical protein
VSDTLGQASLEVIEHLDFDIECKADQCPRRHKGEHSADWLMVTTCGCSGYCCDAFMQSAQQAWDAGMVATCLTCGKFDTHILWVKSIRNRV